MNKRTKALLILLAVLLLLGILLTLRQIIGNSHAEASEVSEVSEVISENDSDELPPVPLDEDEILPYSDTEETANASSDEEKELFAVESDAVDAADSKDFDSTVKKSDSTKGQPASDKSDHKDSGNTSGSSGTDEGTNSQDQTDQLPADTDASDADDTQIEQPSADREGYGENETLKVPIL